MTNERAIQILENLISIDGDIIIGSEGKEALEMAIRSLQQKQKEVILLERDTEDIFAHEYAIYSLPPFVVESIAYGTQLIDFIYKTAHHFYELGKNSK